MNETHPAVATPCLSHQARLLVVDDEPLLRMAIGRGLARFGWDVCLAADGEEALAQLRQEPNVAAVISDITMPGMSGNALAVIILITYPGVPILFVTASQPDCTLLTNPLVDHLSKPVRTIEIRDHLTHLIDLNRPV